MIGKSEVFVNQWINICEFFKATAAATVLEHTFNNGIGTFTMVVDLFLILNNIIGNIFCISQIPFVHFLFHFCQKFFVYLREIIDKI